jgi:hypothetical protein
VNRFRDQRIVLAVRIIGVGLIVALTWLGFWVTKHVHGGSVLILIVVLPACLFAVLALIGVLLKMPIDWFTHDWKTISGYLSKRSQSH